MWAWASHWQVKDEAYRPDKVLTSVVGELMQDRTKIEFFGGYRCLHLGEALR